MNFKTTLLASAAILAFAGTANAADFTGSLYLPGQGQLLSDTAISHSRIKFDKGGALKDLYASEQITYGVTDNFSVVATVGNHFDVEKYTNQNYNNDHNFDYTIGGKYNMRSGNWLSQVGLSYFTYDPKSWEGHRYNNARWYKELAANAQLGYDMGNGWTPYTSLTVAGNIDDAERHLDYTVFGGFHKTADKFAVDAGVRYEFNLEDANTNTWWLQAEANYFVTDNVAVGLFGDYYLGGTGSDEIDYDYTAGLNLKVLF